MIRKHRTILALSRSLTHMGHSINRMKRYESSRSKDDATYAIFHQILALHYETEALRLGLESKKMHEFMCQFDGK